jgi:hypothetical protein
LICSGEKIGSLAFTHDMVTAVDALAVSRHY